PFAILPQEGQGGGALTGGVWRQDFVMTTFRSASLSPCPQAGSLPTRPTISTSRTSASGSRIGHIAPATPAERLRYTLGSILGDDDNWPEHLIRHRVTLLGAGGASA